MKDKSTSRRQFLAAAGLLAGAAAGCTSNNPFDNYAGSDVKASGEMVKFIIS